MPSVRPNKIEMIPISRITVLNPRARNKRQHREIVNNIDENGGAIFDHGSGGIVLLRAA